MTKQEQIQSAVDAAIAAVPFSHRQRDTKTTKKALAEIEALGLTEYLPALMREHGGKYASSVAGVIKAATFAGSLKIASHMGEDGDSWTETTEAHELYNLLNAPVEANAFGRRFTPSQATLDYIARGDHLSTKNYREDIDDGAIDNLLITRVTVGINVDSNQVIAYAEDNLPGKSIIVLLAHEDYGDSYIWSQQEYEEGAAVKAIRECFDEQTLGYQTDVQIQKGVNSKVEIYDLSDDEERIDFEKNHEYEIKHRPCTNQSSMIMDRYFGK